MDLDLNGKRALVTGGSRGIGKAVARQLALEGADVAIAARDRVRIDETVAELAAQSGRRIVGVQMEASDPDSIAVAVAEVAEALGGIDILVNGAARFVYRSEVPPRWDTVTEESLYSEMQVKVLGYLRVIQAVVPHMIPNNWGRIINISGLAARHTGSIVGSIRNISVHALTKNLADELAEYGINVVTVHPALVRTERIAADELARPAANLIGRLLGVEEVANVIAFLASPKSVAINGDAIAAGGGVPRVIEY
jgi:NAD(P)-dependent dehydrogenase (short-subunit alcohol dehydrogenase family)